jgi:hypothetical protein
MKRLTLILCILTLLLFSFAHAQQTWIRIYGEPDYADGRSVQQTTDGGYIVAGATYNFGNEFQVYLVKTNASGDTLWTRNYGGTGDDWGYSVQQTSDGGYIIAGETDSYGNGDQVYLIKTDASGDTLWTRTYGGVSVDYGLSVRQTTDGGYIVGGVAYIGCPYGQQGYLVKTKASGDTLWARTYGEDGDESFSSVQQTTDGGYIIAGTTGSSSTDYNIYLIKTNAQGDTLWTKTYGGAGWDVGYSVQQTTDGGYIVAGTTGSFGNGDQFYLVKTNASGDTLWTRTYGVSSWDWGYEVRQTADGGYIVAGWTYFFGTGQQVYLVKTNTFGDTLWTRTYGGAVDDRGQSVQQTSDGGYIVTGYYGGGSPNIQLYLIKTDANGNVGVETEKVRGQRLEVRITAKPNPFTSFATLPGHEAERFSLYDVSGRKVGTYRGDRVGEGLAPGVYFLRSSDSKDKPLRIVKVR